MPSTELSPEETASLRSIVDAERLRATTQLDALIRTFDELVAAADLEPPDDEHDPDGTTAYERAQVSSLIDETRTALAELNGAGQRLDDGTFGACERCGGAIAIERLSALPATRHCVACAATGRPA